MPSNCLSAVHALRRTQTVSNPVYMQMDVDVDMSVPNPSENSQRTAKRPREAEAVEPAERAPKRTRLSIMDLMSLDDVQTAQVAVQLPSFGSPDHPLSYNPADLPLPLEAPAKVLYPGQPGQKALVAINPDTWQRRELGERWWREARAAGATSRELLEMETALFLAAQGVNSLWDPSLNYRY